MLTLTTDEVIRKWVESDDALQAENKGILVRGFQIHGPSLLSLLAQGRPVTAEQLATKTDRPVTQIQSFFEKLAVYGAEFDENGNLVGAALTLNPTRHRFLISGRTLYAWCALDTLFLPAMLGETADVKSTCPVTGETIRLTITPRNVAGYSPESTVLSITVPGISCSRRKTGPGSDTCSQIHFFSSRTAAESWCQDRPGIAIFTVEEAYRLARANWLDRVNSVDSETPPFDEADCCCC
jgi:alkylmercury lyase